MNCCSTISCLRNRSPRKLFEQDANGKNVHYSPATGQMENGVLSADQGFWDAYRSTYSLLSFWDPVRMSEMMEGWLNQWRESGWIPQWSATHGRRYFWNDRDPQLVVCEIPDYKVVYHEV